MTLDEIENDNSWNNRVTICINGYLSDEAGNGNWNAIVKARPNDKIFVYHFPTVETLMEDEQLKASDFFKRNIQQFINFCSKSKENLEKNCKRNK